MYGYSKAKVEEMKNDLAKQMKAEEELLKVEVHKERGHRKHCPVKVTITSYLTYLNSDLQAEIWLVRIAPFTMIILI